MIFLTVGTQISFDRLVRSVDEWCAQMGVRDVVGQLAGLDHHSYVPRHFDWVRFMPPHDYEQHVRSAKFIVAHAGIGSIISAMMNAKPILLLPRRAALREQRTDHQLATAERFLNTPGVHVAMKEDEIPAHLSRLYEMQAGDVAAAVARQQPDERLIREMRRLIMTTSGAGKADKPMSIRQERFGSNKRAEHGHIV